MTIKPIDLQSNINQISEVSRNEHARTGAIAEQQQLREKEAHEKANMINKRLDELKKGDNTPIRDDVDKRREKRKSGDSAADKNKEKKILKEKGKQISDDSMGHIIDVFK